MSIYNKEIYMVVKYLCKMQIFNEWKKNWTYLLYDQGFWLGQFDYKFFVFTIKLTLLMLH